MGVIQDGRDTADRVAQKQGQVGCGLSEKPHGLRPEPACRQTWDQFFILLVAEFICFVLFFGATAITEGIGRFSEWLAEL